MSTNIFVFGASITYGAWDTEKGGWVQRLRSYLEQNHELKQYFVYNCGISGDTTTMLLDRFETDIKYRQDKGETNIIIFSIGTNDSAFLHQENRQMTDEVKFKRNLEKLFKIAAKYSSRIVCVGLTAVDEAKVSPIPWQPNIFYSNANIAKYNQMIVDICHKNGVLFIDLHNKIEKNSLVDGLHPNAQGHQQIFEIIKEELLKYKVI